MWGRKARRIDALEKHVAFLAGRNDEQAQAIAELDERNARVHRDLQAMRDRFPRLAPLDMWICPVEGHTKVEWRGNVAHCMACDRTSADPVDDPKPTLREERLPLRPGHVDVAELAMPGLTEGERAAFLESAEFFGEAGKDETR